MGQLNSNPNSYRFPQHYQILQKNPASTYFHLLSKLTQQAYIGRILQSIDQQQQYQLQKIITHKLNQATPYVTRLVGMHRDIQIGYCQTMQKFYLVYGEIGGKLGQEMGKRGSGGGSGSGSGFRVGEIGRVLGRGVKGLKYLYDIGHFHGHVSEWAFTWPTSQSQDIQLIDQWILSDPQNPSLLLDNPTQSLTPNPQNRNKSHCNDLYNLGIVVNKMLSMSPQLLQNSNSLEVQALRQKIFVLMAEKDQDRMQIYNLFSKEDHILIDGQYNYHSKDLVLAGPKFGWETAAKYDGKETIDTSVGFRVAGINQSKHYAKQFDPLLPVSNTPKLTINTTTPSPISKLTHPHLAPAPQYFPTLPLPPPPSSLLTSNQKHLIPTPFSSNSFEFMPSKTNKKPVVNFQKNVGVGGGYLGNVNWNGNAGIGGNLGQGNLAHNYTNTNTYTHNPQSTTFNQIRNPTISLTSTSVPTPTPTPTPTPISLPSYSYSSQQQQPHHHKKSDSLSLFSLSPSFGASGNSYSGNQYSSQLFSFKDSGSSGSVDGLFTSPDFFKRVHGVSINTDTKNQYILNNTQTPHFQPTTNTLTTTTTTTTVKPLQQDLNNHNHHISHFTQDQQNVTTSILSQMATKNIVQQHDNTATGVTVSTTKNVSPLRSPSSPVPLPVSTTGSNNYVNSSVGDSYGYLNTANMLLNNINDLINSNNSNSRNQGNTSTYPINTNINNNSNNKDQSPPPTSNNPNPQLSQPQPIELKSQQQQQKSMGLPQTLLPTPPTLLPTPNISIPSYLLPVTQVSVIPELNQQSQPQDSQRQYVTEQYQNGSRYQGQKKSNMRNGIGKFYYKQGSFYDGHWKNNNMHGFGRLYYPNHRLAYQGQWFIDQFHGYGKVFNDDPVHIQGNFDFMDFQKVQEQWECYQGTLVCDSKEGFGKLVLSNGEYYEGNFQADRVHGEGKFVKLNGDVVKGVWYDSKLVKLIEE